MSEICFAKSMPFHQIGSFDEKTTKAVFKNIVICLYSEQEKENILKLFC